LGCQVGHAAEGAVHVTFEVCVVEKFERVATPADCLAAAGEVETFEWVEEGHKSVPVEEDTVNDGKEFGAIWGATIACDDVAFEGEARVGRVKGVVAMGIRCPREAEDVANICFATPGIFEVVEADLAGNGNAQGVNRRDGYGAELHGATKLNLLCEGVVS